jgi:hypothetical protein
MHRQRSIALLCGIVALVAGCATAPEEITPPVALPHVTPFSRNKPGEALPDNWRPWSLSRFKPRSHYELVTDETGQIVVKANARATASGLIQHVDIDPRATPLIHWRWKAMDLVPSTTSADDSPVRVVVSFSGDLD